MPTKSQVMAGPSPRARGQHKRSHRSVCTRRSIPACAGATWVGAACRRLRAVHPRVRGGNTLGFGQLGQPDGPSPRARGQHSYLDRHQRPIRSIPACAGATPFAPGLTRPETVHPRVRGGNVPARAGCRLSPGPSPRARGQRGVGGNPFVDRRSIPACAGATSSGFCGGPGAAVHPRVSGGNNLLGTKDLSRVGPSPRARGQPDLGVEPGALLRSIPACAGATG